MSHRGIQRDTAVELSHVNFGPNSCTLLLAEILNVVQVFSPAQAVTVCYCCYCCSVVSKQKMPKNPGKTRKYLGFSRYFRVLPALDAGDRRGSLPGLPYCCSAGLTLATVVGEPHCCSVVTVNTSNTVQLPTLNSSSARQLTTSSGTGASLRPAPRPPSHQEVVGGQPARRWLQGHLAHLHHRLALGGGSARRGGGRWRRGV